MNTLLFTISLFSLAFMGQVSYDGQQKQQAATYTYQPPDDVAYCLHMYERLLKNDSIIAANNARIESLLNN